MKSSPPARLKKLYRILGGSKGHVTSEWRTHLADPAFARAYFATARMRTNW
jgi:hypothetical protein